uniref:Uncharacterized protein n=1 Tax=Anguilla anguilla TaxID=7936 RepID=A0A0E9WTP1_ANGAN
MAVPLTYNHQILHFSVKKMTPMYNCRARCRHTRKAPPHSHIQQHAEHAHTTKRKRHRLYATIKNETLYDYPL